MTLLKWNIAAVDARMIIRQAEDNWRRGVGVKAKAKRECGKPSRRAKRTVGNLRQPKVKRTQYHSPPAYAWRQQ